MTSVIRRVAQRVSAFLFDVRNAFYEREGKPVSSADALGVVDRRIADAKGLSQSLTGTLAGGKMTTATWAESLAIELRRGHTQAYALGRGGWDRMTAADRAAVTKLLRAEFGHLRDFARDVQSGALSEAQIKARADMYANHLRMSYWHGERASKRASGEYSEERRVMSQAEHCSDCEDMASEGWKELGHFPAPGEDSRCMSNCKCNMEFR